MIPNQIKILSNPKNKTLSFYIKNEKKKWCLVSNYSELSRKKFTSANIFDVGENIINIIDCDYNLSGRGVDIRFEGPEDEYVYLQQCIISRFKERNITCNHAKTAIVVAGKIGSGKSTLIEEMCKYSCGNFSSALLDGCEKYTVHETHTIWYEISGIDIGIENISAAQKTFDRLAEDGVTDFIYCLSGNKIEKLEEDFIVYARSNYPSINILLLLTNYLDDKDDFFVEQLSSHLDDIKVIPILAKSRKTRNGIIEAYGLDDVNRCLFEGK